MCEHVAKDVSESTKQEGMIRTSFVCIYREVVVDEDVGSTDIPGLHPEPGGQGRRSSLLECVAIVQTGGHQDGCASRRTIHTSQGILAGVPLKAQFLHLF